MMQSDDFKNDWYGWLTNQCGHVVAGIGVSLLGFDWLSPALAALLYWAVIEVIAQKNKLWRDSIMDTFFVMAGASLLPAYDHGLFSAQLVAATVAAMLGFGVWQRRTA